MSRTPASYSMTVVRGSTWEDYLDYFEDDKVTPIDLTGYEARMQVRTLLGQFGTTTIETLRLELSSAGQDPRLFVEIPDGGSVANRVRIRVEATDTVALNPNNNAKERLVYGIELYQAGPPEYVIPYATGKLNCLGEVVR